MRVLYCIDRMDLGGTEKQLIALIEGLDRNRVSPFLCTLHSSSVDLSALACPVVELGHGVELAAGTLRVARTLRQYLRRNQVDIVHTFFQDPPTLTVLATRMMLSRPRIVASFRDLGFWQTPKKMREMRLVFRQCDGFIANCQAAAEAAARDYELDAARITVIYNGVAVSSPRERKASTPPTVAVVANLNRPVKRVDLFLDAASLVRQHLPSVQFVILGDGPLRPHLENQAARLGLTGAVTFAGLVPQVIDWLQRADVGVLPSDSEGLSNAILEYMAAGMPTVARAVGGNAELVQHQVTGLLVLDETPKSMAEAIIYYLTHEEARRAAGDRARQVAEAHFSLDALPRRYETFYADLLASRAAAASQRMEN